MFVCCVLFFVCVYLRLRISSHSKSIAGVPFDSVRRFWATLLLRTTCVFLCCNGVASCVAEYQTKKRKPRALYSTWGVSAVRPAAAAAGAGACCPKYARSKLNHRCAFGEPNCTWFGGRFFNLKVDLNPRILKICASWMSVWNISANFVLVPVKFNWTEIFENHSWSLHLLILAGKGLGTRV